MPRRASRKSTRRQHALHDVLIGAPVPQADDRRSEQHAEPRRVARVEQKAGKSLRLGRGRQRPPQVDRFGIGGAQRVQATDLSQTHDQQHGRAGEQHRHVHGFGPQHRLHAAERSTKTPVMVTSENAANQKKSTSPSTGSCDGLVAEDGLDRERAGENRYRRLGEDVADEEDQRQHRARCRRVATLEELRRREYIGAQVERREHPAEHQHQLGMQLPVREGHAGVRA